MQNRLSQVELQVEQIQGQLNFIDDQVAEATVRVELHEKDAAQVQQTDEVENPSLGSAWDRSIQGFLNVVSAVVIGLGYLLPLARPRARRLARHGCGAPASRSQLSAR